MSVGGDVDMVALFEQEAAERVAILCELLLRLDGGDADREVIASLFREAHTLKGAAAVVGLDPIAAIAHRVEEVLAEVRAGERAVTPELVDLLFSEVDELAAAAGLNGPTRARDAAEGGGDGEAAEPRGDDHDHGDPGPLPRREPAAELFGSMSEAFEAARAGLPPTPPAPASTAGEAEPALPARRETARVAVSRLDDLVRLAGEATAAHLRVAELLRGALGVDPHSVAEIRSLMRVLADLQEGTLRARMLPVGAMTTTLRRAARDAARRTGKVVRVEVRGEDTELDRHVHERLTDALLHLVRNAVDHGIEPPEQRRAAGKLDEGTIIVHAMQLGSRVIVTVGDDGSGIDTANVRRRAALAGIDATGFGDDEIVQLVFRPGLSTAELVTDVSGRGIGLDAVRAGLAELRGRIEVASVPGEGTRFRISVPITLTLLPGLIVRVAGQRFALPMSHVLTVLDRSTPEHTVESGPAVLVADRPVPVVPMAALLGRAPEEARGPIVVLAGLDRTVALHVDAIGEQREVLVKAVPSALPTNDLVVGASAEPDGTVLLVLDAESIVERAAGWRGDGGARAPLAVAAPTSDRAAAHEAASRARILVVDDALTVRELQRTILERAGYAVTVAVDGRDALARLADGPFDLVLTDVEMPELDGLELVRTMRADPRYADLPVVVLTSRGSDQDKQAGMEAGADAYIVKAAFDEAALRSVVSGLLGEVAA